MKEIGEIYLGRMNNGAHYLYVSDILARAEADTNVSAGMKVCWFWGNTHRSRSVSGSKKIGRIIWMSFCC